MSSAKVHRDDVVVPLDRWQLFARRTLDIVMGIVVLALLLIPIIVIIVLVATTSRGPVLFSQIRVGRNGEPFTVLKFRTMREGTHTEVLSDSDQRARYWENGFKLDPDDQRITPVGRILRKTSLDELPQLVNVFWGDMSIVGIRPLLPVEVALRSEHDQDLYRLLRPGMTGLWQVEGRSDVDDVDRIALDRRYVEQWSIWRDLWLLLRTPLAVVRVGRTH
ncbi:MAG: sugar transferase [Ilumatobacter sp.]